MTEPSAEVPEAVEAYRQAGHVLMAYLILEAGVADRFFALPIRARDRPALVPEFDQVRLDVDLALTDRPASSLRSLITTPLFLLGGEAAERIYRGVGMNTPLGNSTALSRARGTMYAYMEEFGGREAPESDARFSTVFRNYYEFIEQQVRDHWDSVLALAASIREAGQLSRAAAFELVEEHLSDETGGAETRQDRGEDRSASPG